MDLLERPDASGERLDGGGTASVDARASSAANGTAQPLPPGAPDRVRTYEELDGAEGREVFFRPHRYTPEDLAPVRGTVGVAMDGSVYEAPILDVSQNGVAFVWPSGAAVHARRPLDVVLRFDDRVAFRGRGRVGSVREQGGTVVVGVSFEDFLLDIEEILELRRVSGWKGDGSSSSVAGRSWYVPRADRFEARVSELRLYLEDAKQELDALEQDLSWNVLQGAENPARAALVSKLRTGFVPEVVRLSEEIDAALREIPGQHGNAAAKAWSLRHVDAHLMQAPVLHRARHKPFGYPGDYEVMNFLYSRNFEGSSLFARAVNLAFTQMRGGLAVRYRKDLVKRQLRALLARPTPSGAARVLSIASGPAQELFELFSEVDEIPGGLDIVLFEQDKNALTHAWRRLKSVVDAKFPRQVRLMFLHDSIKRLLRDPELFVPFGQFDLVYSCGLYDYLHARTAVVLTRRLAAASAPGGQLLVANMVDHPSRWLMEHHLDWPLIYRSRDELLELARQAVPDAQHRILEEESRINPFVELVRA